jgi:hypothetical protein
MNGNNPSPRETAAERGREINRQLGTETPGLTELMEALWNSYSADGWGLHQFVAIEDEEQRAVASDLVLSAVEGIEVNVHELALCETDLAGLVGPNGRTMPGPETTVDELINLKRIHRAITDFARAFGSTLDCLAAATIGVLGLPGSIQRASGASLFHFPELPQAAPRTQHDAREETAALFAEHAERDPAGWLAWMLEMRDAVVHRGHLTNVWLNLPRRGAQIAIASDTHPAYLTRVEPHLRGKPWQPDMFSLSGPGAATDAIIWIPEPATRTVAEVKARAVALVDALATMLAETLAADRIDWQLPEEQWRLERTTGRPRATSASQFMGFDPNYPAPPPTQIRAHPRSAARLELAERLRQSAQAPGIDYV